MAPRRGELFYFVVGGCHFAFLCGGDEGPDEWILRAIQDEVHAEGLPELTLPDGVFRGWVGAGGFVIGGARCLETRGVLDADVLSTVVDG